MFLMGARYLGGLIGDDKSKRDWLKDQTLEWEKKIRTITKMAGKYSQESYDVLVCTIKSEFIFLKCVTKYTRHVFAGVDKIILEKNFLVFFVWKIETSPTHHRNLKYDNNQEIWPRPIRPGHIIQQEITHFATCE